MKKFNYYGQEITVPDYANFVATDRDGDIWWYANKPRDVKLAWSNNSGGNCGRVGECVKVKSWRGSLREC